MEKCHICGLLFVGKKSKDTGNYLFLDDAYMSWGYLSWGVFVMGVFVMGGICQGGYLSGGYMSWGYLSLGVFVMGGICHGGICLGVLSRGFCPGGGFVLIPHDTYAPRWCVKMKFCKLKLLGTSSYSAIHRCYFAQQSKHCNLFRYLDRHSILKLYAY